MAKDKAYMRNYMQKRRDRRMTEAIKHLGGKCCRCPSTDNLQFDHKNPNTKRCNVSEMHSYSDKEFWAEVEKCQLLCGSCHTDKTLIDNGQSRATHGSRRMYNNGCRCQVCREKVRQDKAKWRGSTRRNMGLIHGTLNGYRYHKCRCDHCRMAQNAYMRKFRETKRCQVVSK